MQISINNSNKPFHIFDDIYYDKITDKQISYLSKLSMINPFADEYAQNSYGKDILELTRNEASDFIDALQSVADWVAREFVE